MNLFFVGRHSGYPSGRYRDYSSLLPATLEVPLSTQVQFLILLLSFNVRSLQGQGTPKQRRVY